MPVYNTEKYLPDALESLLNQTFKNFELICVDDGSTDNSLNILKEFNNSHNNFIKIISQKNSGIGHARNHGFEFAQYETTLFLDSDDYFCPEFLEKMYRQYQKTKADIVICRYNAVMPSNNIIQENCGIRNKLIPKKEIFNKDDLPEYIFNFTNHAIWNKLFRTEFIKNNRISFDDIPESNDDDVFFMLSSLFFAEKITIIEDSLILYKCYNPNSTTLKRTKRVNSCIFDIFNRLENLIEENNCTQKNKDSLFKDYLGCIKHSLSFLSNPESRLQFIKIIKKEMHFQRFRKGYPIRLYFKFLIIKNIPLWLYMIIYKIRKP